MRLNRCSVDRDLVERIDAANRYLFTRGLVGMVPAQLSFLVAL